MNKKEKIMILSNIKSNIVNPNFDRLDRIESVFFPGNFEDDILESTRNEADEPTCVEMLAGPSFALRPRMTKFPI